FVALSFYFYLAIRDLHSFPTRRSSDLVSEVVIYLLEAVEVEKQQRERATAPRRNLHCLVEPIVKDRSVWQVGQGVVQREVGQLRSEEHTSELQSLRHLVCRLLLEKKNK